MHKRLWKYWRIVSTGISFMLFGLGALVLRFAVFPVLRSVIRNKQRSIYASRHIIRICFLIFIGTMRLLGILKYSVSGGERLNRQGLLIVANHPTLIDTVFLIALTKRADCIVKNELWNNPFTHGPVYAADYINNGDGTALIENCIATLEKGSNLIVFPEGTRTPYDGVIKLKRGAANIAIKSKKNITPVFIRCTPRTLRKNSKWWHVPESWVHVHISVGEDIDISSFIHDNLNEAIAARRLTSYIQDYFNKENAHYEFI